MKFTKTMRGALCGSIATMSAALASDGTSVATPTFAPPVRLQAGDAWIGEERMFPSPVLHDVDRDGRADLVVGDLVGALTYAPRTADANVRFSAEKKLPDALGKPIDFHNW